MIFFWRFFDKSKLAMRRFFLSAGCEPVAIFVNAELVDACLARSK